MAHYAYVTGCGLAGAGVGAVTSVPTAGIASAPLSMAGFAGGVSYGYASEYAMGQALNAVGDYIGRQTGRIAYNEVEQLRGKTALSTYLFFSYSLMPMPLKAEHIFDGLGPQNLWLF